MVFGAFCVLRAVEPINIALMDLRFRLIEQAPSDTLVVVEIDPESIRREERWPWPRDRYAKAITELQNAGAGLIAFDVDFSSLSDQRGDEAFAAALSQRPGEVVLPVFWQWSSRSATDGAIIRTPPHEKFLKDSIVASVTLITEENGVVRRGWRGVQDGDDYRASIASVLAGAEPGDTDAFYIDFSIDPKNIQRLSFQDVLSGTFPPESVRGKNILIGATALELGDEFAAPVYGVTPGVDFHALSYESLIGGRALVRPHAGAADLIGAGILLWLAFAGRRWSWGRIVIVNSLVLAAAIGGPLLIQKFSAVSFDSGAIIVGQIISVTYIIAVRLSHYARQILRQRAATAHYQALTSLVVRDNTDGVIVASATGEVELCNKRARSLLGVDVSGIDGVHVCDIAPGFPLLDITDVCDAPHTENAPRVLSRQSEYTVPGAGGAILEVVASCSSENAVDDDGENADQIQVFVYTLRDISARKRIEAAEKEAKDAAIAANEIKSQLIANMSHELRTPLNGVIGFADILKKEAFGPLGVAEYKEYAQSIHESGVRLLSVFNDMLHVAKLDSGDFELCIDNVALDETIESCVYKLESEVEEQGKILRTKIESDFSVEVDVSVLREIINHLLSNAIKYTESGNFIMVRAERDDNDLVLQVIDNGCGVAEECIPKLTEAFYQGDGALNRKFEGAGLGLYVVAKFVELHGGALSFRSEPGKGFLANVRLRGVVKDMVASTAA